MVEFKELLILTYLNEYRDAYLFSEIKELCNFSTNQMKKSLDDLISKGMLSKKTSRLVLTNKAELLLKEKGLLNVSITDLFQQDTVTLKFIEKPLTFADIYIPKNFKI
ncbi:MULTISPECIES: hypothetical protein [Bacillus]|nr:MULTISPECIES: hypothetical protein [Bacillus]AOR97859.1 hypothetical protein BSBS38_01579 [Bacillus subtilis]ARV98409.1 hypothetical protein S101444_01561 [Bacillus subtilis subsp. subtilis]ARW02485.1 hypothetical protein S100757_01554 [Bacillus subtilis subsp. subtilis]ASB56891.1 hypothetical protein S100761_01562 [Bacillus subtilis subsp. subtilis]MBC9024512.1 hypothetical protein [Bacillus subtilis]